MEQATCQRSGAVKRAQSSMDRPLPGAHCRGETIRASEIRRASRQNTSVNGRAFQDRQASLPRWNDRCSLSVSEHFPRKANSLDAVDVEKLH